MQSAPVAPTMVANPGPTTNPAAGENIFSFKIYKEKNSFMSKIHSFSELSNVMWRCILTNFFVAKNTA